MAYLFDPKNKRKFVDNLTHGEREALRDLSTWNKDEKNPRVIRVQDKGSCFVVDFKAKYVENNLQYVSDPKTFSSDDVDNRISNLQKVSKWTRKWEREGVLGMSECDWIVAGNPKPAKLYANIKTHKTNWPYRFIMSAKGTAMENLAKWLEIQLKPYARKHGAYIKDTKSFLLHLEHLNDMRAPFKDGTKLISLDVENYYPNCQTDLCIQAVRTTLEKYATEFSDSKIKCILEALEITMSSNNGKFLDRNFTQINGATIGGPESASVTDILWQSI